MNKEQFLERELCKINAKCPCGGWYNDLHSHASDCIVIDDLGKAYQWSADQENPTRRNKKRRHDIKGKLSPIVGLVEMVDSGRARDEKFYRLTESMAKQSSVVLPDIIKILDEIE